MSPAPALKPLANAVAVIDEARCIGCTLCIEACPVDAIIGARRYLHTVVAAWCTGCELCVPPCPVDCIAIEPIAPRDAAAHAAATHAAGRRNATLNARLERERARKEVEGARLRAASAERRKRETIEKAMARARERLAQPK